MRSVIRCIAAVCLMVIFVGCGNDLGDVHGRVTIAGQPVTNAIIHFVPESGPQAQGRLDENGNYRLTTPSKGTGAVPGNHRVYFVPEVPESEEEVKAKLTEQEYFAGKLPEMSQGVPNSNLPAKFLSPNTSSLLHEVQSGSNEFNFDLAPQ